VSALTNVRVRERPTRLSLSRAETPKEFQIDQRPKPIRKPAGSLVCMRFAYALRPRTQPQVPFRTSRTSAKGERDCTRADIGL